MAQINKLTERQIKAIKPLDKEQNIGDGDGLYIRVNPAKKGGAISFYYRYRFLDKARRVSIGPYPTISLKEARQARDGYKYEIAKGIDPGEAKKSEREKLKTEKELSAKQPTVKCLYDGWMSRYIASHRKDGGKYVQYMLESDIINRIGHLKLDEVKAFHISDVLDDVVSKGTKRKANSALSLLRQMFKYAVRRGQLKSDPTYGFIKRDFGGIEKPVERTLTLEEVHELAEKLPQSGLSPRIQHAIWILLATGCRVSELSKAKWCELDFKGKTWTIPGNNSKNGKQHIVHLSSFTLKHFEMLLQYRANEYLLAGKKEGSHIDTKAISKAIRDRVREKPLNGRTKNHNSLLLDEGSFTPHDLRRTMASRMGDAGVEPHVIEKCLNHTPKGIVAVYQRQDYLLERKEAFERWGNILHKIESINAHNSSDQKKNSNFPSAVSQ